MRIALAALALVLAGCATAAPPPPLGGRCNAAHLGELVGRPGNAVLGAEALRRSGARRLRWLRPGQMVTMEYRADRLNVHLDAKGQVESFACS